MLTASVAFLLAVVAAAATMLGWAIAASGHTWRPRAFGVTLLLAAGAMIIISAAELLPSAVAGGLSLIAAATWSLMGALVVVALHLSARRLGLGDSALSRSAALIALAIRGAQHPRRYGHGGRWPCCRWRAAS